jgi:hypothetical protein
MALSPSLASGLAAGALPATAVFQTSLARTGLYLPSKESSQSGSCKETADDI